MEKFRSKKGKCGNKREILEKIPNFIRKTKLIYNCADNLKPDSYLGQNLILQIFPKTYISLFTKTKFIKEASLIFNCIFLQILRTVQKISKNGNFTGFELHLALFI